MLFTMALLQNGGRALEDGAYVKEILPKPILNLHKNGTPGHAGMAGCHLSGPAPLKSGSWP